MTKWDISTAEFNQSKDISGNIGFPQGLDFKSDGSRVYIAEEGSPDYIHSYNLSTGWDISTASLNQSKDVSSNVTYPIDLAFKPDGTKLYILDYNTGKVYEYNLSTAWDISTASLNQSKDVLSNTTSPKGLCFKADGTKTYLIDDDDDNVYEYNLSTAWDISTASFNQSKDFSSNLSSSIDIEMSLDGAKMYLADHDTDEIYEYDLSSSWDISTASFNQSKDVTTKDKYLQGIDFKSDGTKLYITGDENDNIYEYDLPADVGWIRDATDGVIEGTDGVMKTFPL